MLGIVTSVGFLSYLHPFGVYLCARERESVFALTPFCSVPAEGRGLGMRQMFVQMTKSKK